MMAEITYRLHRGKYIFCKDGVYFVLMPEEVSEMLALLRMIKEENDKGRK